MSNIGAAPELNDAEAVRAISRMLVILAEDAQRACGIATMAPLTDHDAEVIRGIAERAAQILARYRFEGSAVQ